MCDKIDDEYINFLENYLSDVLTGQMYADVDTVSIEKYLAEMKDSTTGKNLLPQAHCVDLLTDEARDIIDERLQKSICDAHEIIVRFRYCLQMTLRKDFDIPEELVMYILRYINGAIWYVKHKNNTIIDIAKGWIEENPEEYQKCAMSSSVFQRTHNEISSTISTFIIHNFAIFQSTANCRSSAIIVATTPSISSVDFSLFASF